MCSVAKTGDDRASEDNRPAVSSSRVPPPFLLLCSLLIAVSSSFHYGYQITLTNPSEETFLHFVNSSVSARYAARVDRHGVEAIWSVTVSLFFAGAVPGCLFINQVADRLGRKRGTIVSSVAIALCTSLQAASYFLNSIELFAASRFALGFWVIVGTGICAVYLSECSPKACRGAIGTLTTKLPIFGLLIQFGTVIGATVGIPQVLGSHRQWWMIFVLETLVQLILLPLIHFLLHESPSFLLFHGKEADARESIRAYYAADCPSNLEAIAGEMREECKAQADSQGMLDVWRDPSRTTRRGLRVAVVLGLCLSFCGVAVVDAYVVGILRALGFDELFASIANVGIAIGGLFFGILSTCLVDHFGRRPLMLASFAAMIVTNLFITALMSLNNSEQSELVHILLLTAITLFLLGFEFGLGSLFFFLAAEVVGQSARSAVLGWAKLTHTSTRSIVLAIYLPLRGFVGNGSAYALLFLPLLCCASAYLYFSMPESKNRNLAEIEQQLNELPKMRLWRRNEKRKIATRRKGTYNTFDNGH